MVTRFSCLISAVGIKTFMLYGMVIFSTVFAPSLVWCWASGCVMAILQACSALGAFVKINIPTRGTTVSENKKCRGEVCVGL
jgi:hypothetical protein